MHRSRMLMAELLSKAGLLPTVGLLLTMACTPALGSTESGAPSAALTATAPTTPVPLAQPAAPASAGYSAAGLYNLANSYARAGKPGLAVLNYERARLLAPGAPDVEANEHHVRDSLHLPSEPPTRFQRAVTVVGPTPLAWTSLLGILIVSVALLAGRWSSRRRGLRRTALAAGVAAGALTVCNGAVLWPLVHEGVIVANAAPVLVSPVPMGDPLFVLPEAETVSVTAEHEGYALIRTRTGRTGWVSRANLVSVVPK